MKTKIFLPNGRYIERVATFKRLGNFVQGYVTIDNNKYSIGDGDEYIRGIPDSWTLSYSYQHKKYVAYSKEDAKHFKLSQVWIDFGKMGEEIESDEVLGSDRILKAE